MGRRRDSDDYSAEGLPDDGMPADIAAIRRDDALIDAIAGDGPVETQSSEEYELATLLAGWRAEIVSEPLPAGPDFDEVVAAVNREIGARDALATRRGSSSAPLRLLRPLAGAAALVAAALGGAAVFSYSAEPGDPLWGVKSVVFSEQAESTVARIDTTSSLQRAEELIASGETAEAQQLLESAEVRSSAVTDVGQRDELGDWLRRLTEELNRVIPTEPPPLPTELPLAPPPETPDTTVVPTEPSPTAPVTTTPSPSPDATTAPSTTPDPTILDDPGTGTGTPEPTTPTSPTSAPSTPSPTATTPSPVTTTASAPATGTETTTTSQGLPQDVMEATTTGEI